MTVEEIVALDTFTQDLDKNIPEFPAPSGITGLINGCILIKVLFKVRQSAKRSDPHIDLYLLAGTLPLFIEFWNIAGMQFRG